jgi:hypothetical protein
MKVCDRHQRRDGRKEGVNTEIGLDKFLITPREIAVALSRHCDGDGGIYNRE